MRNHRCPQYSRCLDRAIADGRADFDCTGCPHRHDTDDITAMELAGVAALLALLFLDMRLDPTDIIAGDLVAPSAGGRPWADFNPYRDIGQGAFVE